MEREITPHSSYKPHVLLLHGYCGDANSHFLPDLKRRLENNSHVISPSLSGGDTPDLETWIAETLQLTKGARIKLCIAHSLGGTFAMQLISRDLIQIDTLMTIGSSFGPKDDEVLNSFLIPPISVSKLNDIDRIYAVSSFDDPATHSDYSQLLVKQAGAIGVFFNGEGHFTGDHLPDALITLIDAALSD